MNEETSSEETFSRPRATFVEYSRQEVDTDAVMRALVEHDGWFAPALLLAQGYGRQELEHLTMFGEETRLPEGEVWLFTEMSTATRAQEQGALLGAYEGGIWGANLFGGWRAEWGVVRINPGSPAEETLVLQPDAAELLTMWAAVARLEAGLVDNPSPGNTELYREMLGFRDYLLLVDGASREPVYYQSAEYERAMVAFTSPDSMEQFLDGFEDSREQFRVMSVDGPRLFGVLEAFGIDGLCFNPEGPGARYELAAAPLLAALTAT